jgi:membrane-bound ClpP family serine protease
MSFFRVEWGNVEWGARILNDADTETITHLAVGSGHVCVSVFIVFANCQARAQKPVVFVAPIEGVINLGLAPFVQRVLDETTAADATAVILEINTFGGGVDAAVLIRDALLESRILTVTFSINGQFQPGLLTYE